jgi:NAD(P)-dependent dehydrogenase (short-subunit alcohol dehydrogenase family)
MRLQGKTAMVTGGATGIGWGIAQALARDGCRVAIAGRRADKLREAAASWVRKPEILWHPVDVADRTSVAELFQWAEQALGALDILVNSAGVNIANRAMATMQPEQWDQILAINATGAYNCLYYALPPMRARKNGLVINVSSVAGKRAMALGGIAYCASKFAMTALGISVGNECAGDGVRITNIYPGEVNTPILQHRPTPVSDERKAVMLQPDDFGELVVAVACLHPRAHVAEIVIKPTVQEYC